MALKVGELYASFGIDSSGIDSAISGIEKKCSSIASGLGKAGAAASLAITTPIVAIGKDIYDAGTAFYSQMSRVEAISGATAEEMTALTAAAIEMGSTTSFTASEAGEALEYMAMAGWKSEDMLAGLAPIMDLAAASGEDLGSVSDIVTDALTAFGLSAEDAAHFSDVLAATATNANTDVGMMGYTFQQVGALAGAMGYEIDDVAVAIGIMANAGIKGEKAGTQLRAIIANMVDPTEDMAIAMEELGLSLTSSTGEVLPFSDVIGQLRTAFAGLSEEEKAMYAATIAGKEGMAGLLALINASDEDIAKLTESIENCEGATEEMAATILDNAAGDVTIFKSAVEGLEITLWGLVEGPFRKIVQTATSWVDSFRLMDSATQTTILKVAGLAAATGPALIALGGIVGAVGKLIPLMSALVSPIGIVAAGMALFAVASIDATNEIGKGFEKLSKKLKTSLSNINKRISSSMKTISSRMPALTKSISTGLGEIVPEAMNTALLVVTGFADTIADNASGLAEIGKTIVTSVVGGFSANMPQLIPAVARMVVNIGSALVRNIPSLLSSVGELVKSIGSGLRNVDWVGLGKELLDAFGSAFTGIKNQFSTWFSEAKSAIQEIDWSDVGTTIWTSIKSGITATGDWIKELVLGETYTPDSSWSDVGKSIWTSIKSGIKATGDWLAALIMPDGTTFEAGTGWSTIGKSIWESIKSGISATGDWLAGLIMPANTTFTAGAGWKTIGSSVWTAIQGGISATGDWLAALIMPANTTYTAGTGWSTIGKAIWTSIKSGISATGDWIKSLVLGDSYTADADWSSVGSAIWTKIQTGITATGDWIKSLVLKDAFTADSSWADVGEKIIEKISSGLSGLDAETLTAKIGDLTAVAQSIADKIVNSKADWAAAAGTFISSLVGGLSGYNLWDSLATSFSSIATSILGGITAAIPKLSNVAVDIINAIGSLLTGAEGESLVSGMKTIATSIINGVVGAIPSITTAATDIVSAIGTLLGTIDWANAVDCVTGIGDALWSAINEGIKATGTVATSLVDTLGSVLGDIDWESVTVSLDGFASMLINGIVNGIENLSTAATSIVTAIGNLLGNVDWTQFSQHAQKIGGTLIDGIVTGITTLTSGATDIVNAISDTIEKINWAELGDAASDLAGSLFDGIVEGLGKLDFNDFLTAIGNGIAAAGEGLGEAAGSIVNNLITAILTPANWLKLIELGGKLIEGIATGILNLGKGILEGAWSFVSETLKGLFEALGFEFTEWSAETETALDQTVSIINGSGEEINTSLQNAITNMSTIDWVGGMNTESLSMAMQSWSYVVENGTDELVASLDRYAFLGCAEITNLFQILCDETASAADRAAAMIALNDLGFGEFVSASFASCDNEIIAAARRMSENGVDTFEAAFSVLGITIPESVQAGLDAGLPLVEAAAKATADAASTANDQATTAAAAAATGMAVTDSLAKAEADGEGDVTDASTGIVDASTLALETFPDIAALTGEEGTTGMADAINNNAGLVETAMSTMSADAVEAALAEMSYSTGYSTGYDYVDAICDGIDALAATLKTDAETAAQAACAAASNALSSSAGNSIGRQFANGIAAGIRAGSSAITAAARSAAYAALAAAKSALGIHSPSAVAKKEVGWMYDKGIALGLLEKLSVIRKAGSEVAASMHDMFLVEDPSRGTVYSSQTAINQTAKKTAEATGEGKAAQERAETIGKAIADRLIESGALEGDVYMDKDKVGEKVAAPVSKKIKKKSQTTVKGRSLQGVLA